MPSAPSAWNGRRPGYLPRLWASRKLGYLTRRVWTEGESRELTEEIRKLALRYGLPSPFTSYLVQEPGTVLTGMDRSGGTFPALAGRQMEAAPAFSTQGAQAVDQARRAKAFRDVASMTELREAEEEALVTGAPLAAEDTRWVSGRLFKMEDGVWRDVEKLEGGAELVVAPFTPAYFELLDLIPELRSFAREFTHLEVQGTSLRVSIRGDGLAELTSEARASARTAFLSS